ncbi:hypothetical protein FHG87_015521 [Trinorchestia longiramus]|nr:hypothetical protein FHG87_015521 [Trinorchestia longiramus]
MVSLKQCTLDRLTRLVCSSISKPLANSIVTYDGTPFSLRMNRKRRRSNDEQTKCYKKIKLAVNDSKRLSPQERDATEDLFTEKKSKGLSHHRNVVDVSICLKKYLSILPDKIWTDLYYKVIREVKSKSSEKTLSRDTSEDDTEINSGNGSICSSLEKVLEIFVCPKLLEFDTTKLNFLSPSETTVALQKIKYCCKLQHMIADAVPADVRFPRDVFTHFHQLRRLHLTGGPEKLCFYWTLKHIAMHCTNITHLKIAYNPDTNILPENKTPFESSQSLSEMILAHEDTSPGMCSHENNASSSFNFDSGSVNEKNTDGSGRRLQNFDDADLHIESKSYTAVLENSVSCLRKCQHLKRLFLFNFGRKCESSELKILVLSLTSLDFIYHKELVNAISDIYEEHISIHSNSPASFADTSSAPSQNQHLKLNHNSNTSTAQLKPYSRAGGRTLNLQVPVTKLLLRTFSLHVQLKHYGEQRVYASPVQLMRVTKCCPYVRDLTVVAPPALDLILNELQLKALTIIQCPRDTTLSEALCAASAVQLTHLSLSEIILSHADFASVSAVCQALEVINVCNCGLLNDFSCLHTGNNTNFSAAFPNLREIRALKPDAQQPWCFGGSLAQFLLRGNRKIEKLELELKCSDLDPRDDIEGETLVRNLSENSELLFIELISPPFLSRDCVNCLIEKCPKLMHVGKRSSWPFGYEISYNVPLQIDFV